MLAAPGSSRTRGSADPNLKHKVKLPTKLLVYTMLPVPAFCELYNVDSCELYNVDSRFASQRVCDGSVKDMHRRAIDLCDSAPTKNDIYLYV